MNLIHRLLPLSVQNSVGPYCASPRIRHLLIGAKSVLTPMRNCNIWAISCLHSALTARLSHLLIHCNEKLHFHGFWNRSSDLCRFLFQELCYGIRLLMRSINDLSIACNLAVRLSPNHDMLCRVLRVRVFIEWKRYRYVSKMKMGVKFIPSQLAGWQTDIYEVHCSTIPESRS